MNNNIQQLLNQLREEHPHATNWAIHHVITINANQQYIRIPTHITLEELTQNGQGKPTKTTIKITLNPDLHLCACGQKAHQTCQVCSTWICQSCTRDPFPDPPRLISCTKCEPIIQECGECGNNERAAYQQCTQCQKWLCHGLNCNKPGPTCHTCNYKNYIRKNQGLTN